MGRGTSPSVALVVGTVEILDLGIALIEMVMEVVSAVGTNQETRKHIFLPIISTPSAPRSSFLLYLLPHGAINNRFVYVLENDPILTVIINPFFVLIRFRVGLEIEDIAAVFLKRKNFGDGRAIPPCRR